MSLRIMCKSKKAYNQIKNILDNENISYSFKDNMLKIKNKNIENHNEIFNILNADHISYILYNYDKKTNSMTRITSKRDEYYDRVLEEGQER